MFKAHDKNWRRPVAAARGADRLPLHEQDVCPGGQGHMATITGVGLARAPVEARQTLANQSPASLHSRRTSLAPTKIFRSFLAEAGYVRPDLLHLSYRSLSTEQKPSKGADVSPAACTPGKDERRGNGS